MRKYVIYVLFFTVSILKGDYLDIAIENIPNYQFKEYLFKDINKSNTEVLEKKVSFTQLHLSGNFNNFIGFNYYKNDLSTPNKMESKEIYIGSDKTKFLGYAREETNVLYGSRINKSKTVRYTVYDLLTIEKNDLESNVEETFYPTAATPTDISAPVISNVTRKFNYEKIMLSSENLYNHVRENALDGENYFNFGAVSQNFSSMFRLYGVVIASYEQHDYSKGRADYTDANGTHSIYNGSVADIDKLVAREGKFKGFGYGYKITAEAYWKDMSLFITSYYKKIDLKNYHTDIRDAESGADPVANIISDAKLTYLQKYTSFGLNYRF